VAAGASTAGAATWMTMDLQGHMKRTGARSFAELKFEPEAFGAFVRRVDEGSLSSAGGKAVLEEMVDRGGDVDGIIESMGLAQVSDASALEAVVDRILAENPGPVEQFLGGKEGALNALIGPVMRETGQAANPKVVAELLRKRLTSPS
jgi:aspartyl-tRNA(Asn)/glutamyl-tRNA(Gln) amidotransferase subunit B